MPRHGPKSTGRSSPRGGRMGRAYPGSKADHHGPGPAKQGSVAKDGKR